MDSLLDLDHSELESHLFTHLSELGRRDEEASVATEEDVDIDEFQAKTSPNKNNKYNGSRSATKTGPMVSAELGSRGRPRKSHEVRVHDMYNPLIVSHTRICNVNRCIC